MGDFFIENKDALPSSFVLNGHYVIEEMIGRGGFGITYSAFDTNLRIKVAIKELYLRKICRRRPDGNVTSPDEYKEVFDANRKNFLEEARVMAGLGSAELPGIVKVREFFEDNSTAYIVMEREDIAQQRNATIHAYLAGYGNACDAFHQTASSDNGEGAYLAMREAIEMAGITVSTIDYVNAHGTGTPNNDLSESVALHRIFGNDMPPVSSTKSHTGHTTSASGSIEAVICLLAMRHRFIPSNLGWQHAMEGGILPSMGVSNIALRYVLCNAFGFGGNDSSLIFTRV